MTTIISAMVTVILGLFGIVLLLAVLALLTFMVLLIIGPRENPIDDEPIDWDRLDND